MKIYATVEYRTMFNQEVKKFTKEKDRYYLKHLLHSLITYEKIAINLF